MRLDKFLSHTGFGSRKAVKEILKNGTVSVNGKIEKNGKLQISEEIDCVCVNGEEVFYQQFIYYIMNKPKGVISATEDAQHKTVLDLIKASDLKKGLFPVGRLDKDTTGLLLITNDGALAHDLLAPKKKVPKTYQAIVSGIMTDEDIKAFKEGLTIDKGEICLPANLIINSIDEESKQSHVQIEISEGKYHQIKRMVKAVGKEVVVLNRLKMGGLLLDESLKRGEYRIITADELRILKEGKKETLFKNHKK